MELTTILSNLANDIEVDTILKYIKKDFKKIPQNCFGCHYCSSGADLCFYPDNKQRSFKDNCKWFTEKGSISEKEIFPLEIIGMMNNMYVPYIHFGFYDKVKKYFDEKGWDIDKFMYASFNLGTLSAYRPQHLYVESINDLDVYPLPSFIRDYLKPYVEEWKIVIYYTNQHFDIDMRRKAHEERWSKDSISTDLYIDNGKYRTETTLFCRGSSVYKLSLDETVTGFEALINSYSTFTAEFEKYENVTHCMSCYNWYNKGCSGGAADLDDCGNGFAWVDWTKYFYDYNEVAV